MITYGENYRYQLLDYGPFDIPQKKRWIIVGSGPSSDDFDEDALGPEVGVIALNSAFRPLKHVDISIQSHYEDCYIAYHDFHKCDLVFIANPLHVGFRAVPVSTINLFNYDDLAYYYPFKIRWFEKEMGLDQALLRKHTLFCKASIISAAIYLLWRNDVKNIDYCGIDGGRGRGRRYKDMDVYKTEGRTHPNYDPAPQEMNWLAEKLGVKLSPLKKGLYAAA